MSRHYAGFQSRQPDFKQPPPPRRRNPNPYGCPPAPPAQTRRPTCWDPPWTRQTTAYHQSSSYEPDMYSPPPPRRRPTCWEPPAYRETPGQRPFHEVSAYEQPPRTPNSRRDQPQALNHQPQFAGRQTSTSNHHPTRWDQHQDRFQQPRPPSYWNPPELQHTQPAYQQPYHGLPRQPTCWDPPAQHQTASSWCPPRRQRPATCPLEFNDQVFDFATIGGDGRSEPMDYPEEYWDFDEYWDAADSQRLSHPYLRHDPSSSSIPAAAAVPPPPLQRSSSCWSPTKHHRQAVSCLEQPTAVRNPHAEYHQGQHEYKPSRSIPPPPPPSHRRSAAPPPAAAAPPPPMRSDRPPKQPSTSSPIELPSYAAPRPCQPLQPLPVTAPLLASTRHPQAGVSSSRKKEWETTLHDGEEKREEKLIEHKGILKQKESDFALEQKRTELLNLNLKNREEEKDIDVEFKEVKETDKALNLEEMNLTSLRREGLVYALTNASESPMTHIQYGPSMVIFSGNGEWIRRSTIMLCSKQRSCSFDPGGVPRKVHEELVDEEVHAIEVSKIDKDDGLLDSSTIAAFAFDGGLATTYGKRVGADALFLLYPSINTEKLQNLYIIELQDARREMVNGLSDMSFLDAMKRTFDLRDVYTEYMIVGYWGTKQLSFAFDPGGDISTKLPLATLFVVLWIPP